MIIIVSITYVTVINNTGSDTLAALSCTADQIVKWDATGMGTWECSSVNHPHYTVTNTVTVQPGERIDVEARCDPGDALIGNYLEMNTFPAGFSGGNGPVVDQNSGNVDRDIQVGWQLNVNNRDGVSTNFPVDGEVTALCLITP